VRNFSPIILTRDRSNFREVNFIYARPSTTFTPRRQAGQARKRGILRASKKLRFTVYQREYRRAASGRSALPPTTAAFSSRIICCRRRMAAVIAYITIR